jgi:hypothetical protein
MGRLAKARANKERKGGHGKKKPLEGVAPILSGIEPNRSELADVTTGFSGA